MTFTRRPTGFENPADYIFMFDGKDVGRCYRGLDGSNQKVWLWTIYGSSLKGREQTLDLAQERFKDAFLAWRNEKGPPR